MHSTVRTSTPRSLCRCRSSTTTPVHNKEMDLVGGKVISSLLAQSDWWVCSSDEKWQLSCSTKLIDGLHCSQICLLVTLIATVPNLKTLMHDVGFLFLVFHCLDCCFLVLVVCQWETQHLLLASMPNAPLFVVTLFSSPAVQCPLGLFFWNQLKSKDNVANSNVGLASIFF